MVMGGGGGGGGRGMKTNGKRGLKTLVAKITPGGTGTNKCGTSTEWPLPLFAQVVPVPVRVVPVPNGPFLFFFLLFSLFFSIFCKFGTLVPIYRYTLFECPPSRIPLNAHFSPYSYSAQPDCVHKANNCTSLS